MKPFCSITDAIKEIKKDKMLIIVDNPTRENEGDFYFPAELVTPNKINFLLTYGKGLVCAAIGKSQAAKLQLTLMVDRVDNTEKTKVNFSVSVNAAQGITTGVSAYDRANTIRVLSNPKSKPYDLTRPGHVFPLIAEAEGLLQRSGHTEAAVTLSTLADFNPSGVLCEILKEDGRTAKISDLIKLAKKLRLKIVSIQDLIKYLKTHPISNNIQRASVIRVASSSLPTKYGIFQISIYKSLIDDREHAALSMGSPKNVPILVRIHSQCLTGDTFYSLKCDCREQLEQSMKIISKNKNGLIIYLNQEGRGIGLSNKIKAYQLQDKGLDTVEANKALGFAPDARDYQIAADILKDLGISKVILLTNNPNKIQQLRSLGITIQSQIPLEVTPTALNKDYLRIKKQKLGHLLESIKV
ncbi:GTP cyclohydrolase II [Candidatus Gottesmanbacteria bacterium]|nr:GTP cyclohydrolase II [Candidatus Gottesmanbacteria bacterium]